MTSHTIMHLLQNLRMAVLESGIDYLAVAHHKSHGLNIMIKSHLAPGLNLLPKIKSPFKVSSSSGGMLISSNDLGSYGRSHHLIRLIVCLSAFLVDRHGTKF